MSPAPWPNGPRIMACVIDGTLTRQIILPWLLGSLEPSSLIRVRSIVLVAIRENIEPWKGTVLVNSCSRSCELTTISSVLYSTQSIPNCTLRAHTSAKEAWPQSFFSRHLHEFDSTHTRITAYVYIDLVSQNKTHCTPA
jgi:hypothetical protein